MPGPVARQLAAPDPPAGHSSPQAQCEALVRAEERLRGAHAEPVAAPGEPKLAPAVAIDEESVRAQHERDALDGLSLLSRGARRDARALAARRAAAAIAALREQDEAERYERLREEKAAWELLRSNDPAGVLTALDASFEAALTPAVPVDCDRSGTVAVVLLFDSPRIVPDMRPGMTAAGKPTPKARTRTEMNDLYADAVCSAVLATAAQTFAVAPGAETVTVLAVRREVPPEVSAAQVAPIACSRFERAAFESVRLADHTASAAIGIAAEHHLERQGRLGDVVPLELSGDPQASAVVRAVAAALEARVDPASRLAPAGAVVEDEASAQRDLVAALGAAIEQRRVAEVEPAAEPEPEPEPSAAVRFCPWCATPTLEHAAAAFCTGCGKPVPALVRSSSVEG